MYDCGTMRKSAGIKFISREHYHNQIHEVVQYDHINDKRQKKIFEIRTQTEENP